MPVKSYNYAMYEAIQSEMRRDQSVIFMYEYQTPVAGFGTLPIINLQTEFGFPRVSYSAIDESWYVAGALGAARAGLRPVTNLPHMGITIPFHFLTQGAKLHYESGGQECFPAVFITEMSGMGPGGGASHSEYEADSWFMHTPGLKTVIPSTAYDAKGLMISAIRSPDPIVYLMCHGLRTAMDQAPDESYEVPIGEAAVRVTGTDLTLVSSGQGMPVVLKATQMLQEDGVSVETIDLRTLLPLDRKTIIKSVQKTGRLLTLDMTYYTLAPGAEVVATCAEGVPGAKFKRIAFPDCPVPGAPEMLNWMKPNESHVYEAAKRLLRA